MIFTTSLDMATAFLDRDRIGQDWDPALEAMSDSSWVQDIAHARVETTETGWKTTRNSSIVHQQTSMGPSSTPTLEIADLIGLNMAMVSAAAEQQSSSFGHGTHARISDMESLSIGNKDLAQVALSSSAQAGSLEFIGLDSEERGLEHQSLLPRFHGEGAASLGRTQASPSQYVNGVLGEYFIFKLLQNILPGFTVDNWTSELRGCIPDPEFTPYTIVAVADFQYRDTEGVLTGTIFGDDVRRRWQDHWPDYYLEVKTTSNEAATSFHMSSRQLQLASDYTMPPNGETPPVVYVLVRVSNIRSPNTSYKWCPDPHRSLFTKQMRILSDVELTLDYS
ncbi:hypothetical protein C8J57DRAFT_575483 [Mycena rebaudengoi]|nr:hypothetical protein C8J57DRAFT_575483 [Mycena rebaudengoi]